jgi:hypothetical protein
MTRLPALLALALLIATPGLAEVPTYRVDTVAPFTTATTLRGASPAGHLVGETIEAGYLKPFVATLETGLVVLPLPADAITGIAFAANSDGVIVGTVAETGLPWDQGEPAIWLPDGQGGYTVEHLEYPATVQALGQTMPTSGGQAIAINEAGQIVGFTRIQGFIGGPATLFSRTEDPVNLQEAGFQAAVRALNNNGVIVGDGLRMDLATGDVTDLGVPEPANGIPFTNVLGFAINDHDEVVAAADLASTVYENYLTYLHNDSDGWIRLNPAQLPSRFVGFYDNNDLGDVSASGGVLFRDEGVLVSGYDELLEASFAAWDVNLGFIDDARRVATTAIDGGTNALVLLTPLVAGDANVDDLVDVDDLIQVAASYGLDGTAWASGDFDRDGSTLFADLLLMAANYDDPTPLDGLGLDPAFLADWEDAMAAQDVTAAPDVASARLTAHPNPFNPQTTIRFADLPADARGSVRIYDLRGQLVRTLHEGPFAGDTFVWTGRDDAGDAVATGVYLVEGRTAEQRSVVKVLLAK